MFLAINELPYATRRDNTILATLWIDSGAPKMNIFLRPVIEELRKLHEIGFNIDLNTNNFCHIRIYTIVAPVDSSARAKLLSMTQFNGNYGCYACLNADVRIRKGNGHCLIYRPFIGDLRTEEKVIIDASTAICQRLPSVQGIKGFSPLLELPIFNIVTAFTPDYMHAVLLGVVNMFFLLLFDQTYTLESLGH